MAEAGTFVVDLAELDAVIADVEACETKLETLTNNLEGQVAKLQAVWEGLAAEAQRTAHEQWEEGMADMRASLADMREAARMAHGHYTAGAEANVQMWESIS